MAIDASKLSSADNVLVNLAILNPKHGVSPVPPYFLVETEVGEIAGPQGLSTAEEAAFHMESINANVPPKRDVDLLAVNNGTTHGVTGKSGIRLELTQDIAAAIAPLAAVIAQHGSSGTPLDRIGKLVRTGVLGKINYATAVQNHTFGLVLNAAGDPVLLDGKAQKHPDRGFSARTHREAQRLIKEHKLSGTNPKQLSRMLMTLMLNESMRVQNRMWLHPANYIRGLMADTLNTSGAAAEVVAMALETNHYDPGPVVPGGTHSAAKYTPEYIREMGDGLDRERNEISSDVDTSE